jgi:integrase
MPHSDKPRFFVEVKTKRATLYYWQPSAALRKQGHRQRRLKDDRAAAVEQCQAITAQIEAEMLLPGNGVTPGTMAWVIREFKGDHRYRTKRKKTRQGYDQNMAIIERVLGDVPAASVTRPALNVFYNEMHKRTPWQANAALTMLRRLLFFAIERGLIVVNPASKMEMAGNPPRQEKWEDADLAAFLPTAKARRPSIWLATILGAELGQRQADILKLRREDLRVRGFHVIQNKGGSVVEVPCSARLREALAEVPRKPGFLIVSETTGRPYASYNFSHVFAAIRAETGIVGLRYQDLRRTCVVNLARAGCTPPEIAAVTGHKIDTVVDILETYLPRDGVMAGNAIAKLDLWRSERSKRAQQRNADAARRREAETSAAAPPQRPVKKNIARPRGRPKRK